MTNLHVGVGNAKRLDHTTKAKRAEDASRWIRSPAGGDLKHKCASEQEPGGTGDRESSKSVAAVVACRLLLH